ncbi:MAG: hypothetical protein J0L78_10550 [Planctomycetes bacterium]|nr:hypothetical protein [Planctomycetota bacterium]
MPVIFETRRFGAGAIIALVSVATLASNEAFASMADSAVTTKVSTRLSKRVDAINTGNYGAHLPGALTVLSSTLSAELEMAMHAPYNAGPDGLGRFAPVSRFETDIVLQQGTADEACRVIYRSDFDSPVQDTLRTEWSYGDVRETPQGRRFLGTIGNGSTTLTVSQAPKNGDYVIQFDVLAIGGWQGNRTSTGLPEVWGVRVVDGPILAETNFATTPGSTQAYPDAVGRSNFEAGYQAIETFTTTDGQLATVYRLTYRFNRAAEATESGSDDVRIEFFARGLSSQQTSAWGLTNVVLALVPDSGGKGGGAGTGTKTYHGNWDNAQIAGYLPNDFGMMPAGGSKTEANKSGSDREVPAPGSILVLVATGLFGIKRKR